MVEREIFLKKRTLDEALEIWNKVVKEAVKAYPLSNEEVSTFESLGRVVADPVVAKLCSPAYNASAVDGFAIHSSKTADANIKNPKELFLSNDAIPVNTGDPIPKGFDGVVMIEDVELSMKSINPLKKSADYKGIKVPFPVSAYKNVRMIGDDFSVGDILIHPNQKIRAEHIAVMIASGVKSVFVKRRPVVCIIPTGEEIKAPFEKLAVPDIVDTNSYMIKNIVEGAGGAAYITEILPNNEELISKAILSNVSNADFIVVVGGSAKGNKDLVSKIFAIVGEVLIHGLSIQPGKPFVLAVSHNKPLIGMPGFPVSCYLDTRIFLEEAIRTLTDDKGSNEEVEAFVLRPIPSSIGVEEYIRVRLGDVGGKLVAVPLKKGAGVLTSVTNADGIFVIPNHVEGIESGSKVKVNLLESKQNIENQLLFIGSNDPLLDALVDYIAKRNTNFRIGVINTGSFGGLLALERGECSISSVHLFDDMTGTYNKPFLEKYVSKDIIVVKFSLRDQGLILKRGNPKNILSISDLIRNGIKFVNRQQGSGTRVLFDYLLKRNKIPASDIAGYEYEEYTHLGIANAVKFGGADCGMGIRYVADMFDLDFVSVKDEEYDLLILKSELQKKSVRLFIDTLASPEFREFAKAFKGYKYIGGFDEKKN